MSPLHVWNIQFQEENPGKCESRLYWDCPLLRHDRISIPGLPGPISEGAADDHVFGLGPDLAVGVPHPGQIRIALLCRPVVGVARSRVWILQPSHISPHISCLQQLGPNERLRQIWSIRWPRFWSWQWLFLINPSAAWHQSNHICNWIWRDFRRLSSAKLLAKVLIYLDRPLGPTAKTNQFHSYVPEIGRI